MKYGVVYYKESKNIGDDIQTYAAMQLVPKVDFFIDRENMNHPDTSELVKVIANGWYMKQPANWPPAPNLIPLFIAFHISNKHNCASFMANPSLKKYYSQFGTVGCRDKETLEFLAKSKIEAEYSGCLTLTLNRPEVERSNEILFVDALLQIEDKTYLKKCIDAMVPDGQKEHVKLITHHQEGLPQMNIDDRMRQAKNLLTRFAKAKIVVTSRIHCALPCVAMGTPVVFIDVGYDRPGARNRFDGIIDYFNVIGQENFPMSSRKSYGKLLRFMKMYELVPFKKLSNIIDWENIPQNAADTKELRNRMLERVDSFLVN